MTYKTAAIFYHVNDFNRSDADCAGHVSAYLKLKKFEIIDYFFCERDKLPENTDDYDVLFVLGGPGSVADSDRPEWMTNEIAEIKRRLGKKQKIIGLCLGAQMLAIANGAEVSRNKFMEFGFHSVDFHLDTDHPVLKNIPKSEIFMHWHHDGFSPPAGAVNIASNSASLHEEYDHWCGGSQGFVHDDYLGLQFHPEMSLDTLNIYKNMMDDTTERYNQAGSLVQELGPLYLTNPEDIEANCARDVFYKLLDNFLGFAK